MGETKKIFMLGSSGLVGSTVYSKLLLDKATPELFTFARRSLHLHGSVERVGDLMQIYDMMQSLDADTAFCAVGTTLKKARSREAFEEVDLNLPLRFAVAARQHGVKHFHLLTALGSGPCSSQFYLRVKGNVEMEMKTLGFESLHIYRPSLLIGEREEFRLGEELAAGLYKRFQFAYPKALDKYRPIEVDKLAGFIVRKIMGNSPGLHVWENQAMLRG